MKARFGMAMLGLLLAVVWFGSRGYAHVTNEFSVYEDLEFSEAKEQVLLLSGLNLFPHDKGVQLFRPQEKLTSQLQCAQWGRSRSRERRGGERDL